MVARPSQLQRDVPRTATDIKDADARAAMSAQQVKECADALAKTKVNENVDLASSFCKSNRTSQLGADRE